MKSVKILVVYHKKAELVDGKDFLPINAGRAVADEQNLEWLISHTLSDADGDNISALNPYYNEMTAVYYAWKNLDADYYGLSHYRRHFKFSGGDKNYYTAKKIDGKFNEKIGYSPEKLQQILSSFDFVCPKPMKEISVYEHYKNAHDVRDFDKAIEIINSDFPEFSAVTNEYVFGKQSYFYNMFIFDKPTFFRYCEFVFGVLDKLDLVAQKKRAFISERLTGIFITKLIHEGKRGLFLPTVYIESKIKFRQATELTKKNLKTRSDKGARSLVYACKPLLEFFLPTFVFRAYRNRK